VRDTKGFARNSFRKYWCNFLGQQRVIIGESGEGAREREGAEDEKGQRMRKEIDIKQGERRERGGDEMEEEEGRKKRSVMWPSIKVYR